MTEIIDAIENIVESAGYKMTYSRYTMLGLFIDCKAHLRPEDVYQMLRDREISLPTVYRNIAIFKDLGIIKEITINEDHYYELNMYNQKKMHMHFRCSVCGQIKEYSDRQVFKAMIQQKDAIEAAYQDQIQDVTIVMTGICKTCKEK